MADPIRCTGCGLMGLRDENGLVVEALPTWREAPSIDPAFPVCVVGKRSFRADFKASLEQPVLPHEGDLGMRAVFKFQNVVTKDHHCKDFECYREGITPKEHREMLDRKWRDDTDERRRKSDRRWHIGEFVVSLIVFGLLIAGATIVGAFIQKGGVGDREIAVQPAQTGATAIVIRKGSIGVAGSAAGVRNFCVTYRVGNLSETAVVCAPSADHPCFSSAVIGGVLPRECSEVSG